ncbi:MAG: DUF99 family protein [Candidatus Micrarchaeaceae archaeon]
MKPGVRILALDDSSFSKRDRKARIVGMIGRQGTVEGALSYFISVDGNDATEKTINAIRGSRFANQIKLVALQSLLFAGLNIMDMLQIKKELNVEVVAITRKKPRNDMLLKAIKAAGVKDMEKREQALRNISAHVDSYFLKGVYTKCTKGIGRKDLEVLLPEMLSLIRLAHIVATAVSAGESGGAQ